MGAPTGTTESNYPTVEAVLNRARAIVNDAYKGGAGIILKDTAPFTVQFLNGALEELQDRMGNSAAEIVITYDNIILTPITPVPAINPQTQLWIGYTGFFNGTEVVSKPVLPSNIISIKKVEETQTGSGLPFQPMVQPMEGLPSCNQGPWLRIWEYRGDRIYLTGSTSTEDLRIRGEIRFADISPNDVENFANIQIQILASTEALATLVAYRYARARGAVALTQMKADAEYFIKQIRRRYSRRAQGVQYIRQGYGQSGDIRSPRLPW
jgi:hypothetical protein